MLQFLDIVGFWICFKLLWHLDALMSKRKGKKIDNVLNNPSTPPSSEAINSSHEINISDNSSSDKGSSKRKNKKRKRNFNSSTQGRWTDEEHKKFVEGMLKSKFISDLFVMHALQNNFLLILANIPNIDLLGLRICGK